MQLGWAQLRAAFAGWNCKLNRHHRFRLARAAVHIRRALHIVMDAYWHFLAADGWAIASHIALSTLMAMFPFFILLTSLAGLFGSGELADKIARLLLTTWPAEVADPIAREIDNVLTGTHTGTLTISALLALYFASSGVESLRIGLNRAYGMVETRNWVVLRVESIGYVLLAALALLALGGFIILGPLLYRVTLAYVPGLTRVEGTITFVRFAIASTVLIIALFVAHKWLPAGRRRLSEIVPGILITLILWVVTAAGFGRYLAEFSFTYVHTYAGLASAMIALVFLYWTATIFVYGGELNAARLRARLQGSAKNMAARRPDTGDPDSGFPLARE
jgi:membrane protein